MFNKVSVDLAQIIMEKAIKDRLLEQENMEEVKKQMTI